MELPHASTRRGRRRDEGNGKGRAGEEKTAQPGERRTATETKGGALEIRQLQLSRPGLATSLGTTT